MKRGLLMRKLMLSFTILFSILGVVLPVWAGTVSIRCSNNTGSVQVELTGLKTVTLLGKVIEEAGAREFSAKKTFEAETTDLYDMCYKYKISDKKVLHTENAPGGSLTSYYTVQFEMWETCPRAGSSVYDYLVQPKTGSIKELLLCEKYRGL